MLVEIIGLLVAFFLAATVGAIIARRASGELGTPLQALIDRATEADVEAAQKVAEAVSAIRTARDAKIEQAAIDAQNLGVAVAERIRKLKGAS